MFGFLLQKELVMFPSSLPQYPDLLCFQEAESLSEGAVVTNLRQEEDAISQGQALASQKQFSPIESFSKDAAHLFIRLLSRKSLLSFELASHRCMELCRRRWKELVVGHRLDFDWRMCTRLTTRYPSKYPERMQFVLGKVLRAYVKERKEYLSKEREYRDRLHLNFVSPLHAFDRFTRIRDLGISQTNPAPDESDLLALLGRMIERFNGMMEIYPPFGAFVYEDLRDRISFDGHDVELYKRERRASSQSSTAGDLLFEAIQVTLQVSEEIVMPRNKISQSVAKAVAAGATCASVFACELKLINMRPNYFLYRLSAIAVAQACDYRAMRKVVKRDGEKHGLYYVPRPPEDSEEWSKWICAAIKDDDAAVFKDSRQMFQAAVDAYGPHVPCKILAKFAQLEAVRTNWAEAEILYHQAIDRFFQTASERGDENPFPLGDWTCLALIKAKLGKTGEAEVLLNQSIKVMERDDTIFSKKELNQACVYINGMIRLIFNLEGNLRRAGQRLHVVNLYERCEPSNISEKVVAKIHHFMGIIDSGSYSWELAEEHFEFALKVYASDHETMSASVLFLAAFAKSQLKKWREADEFYSRAFEDASQRGELIATVHLYEAAFIKLKLKKWQAAETLYDRALARESKEDLSAVRLCDAAFIKSLLAKLQEADDLYNLALILSREKKEDIPTAHLCNAVFIKLQLKKGSEADGLYNLARIKAQKKGEDISRGGAAFIASNKENLFKADDPYNLAPINTQKRREDMYAGALLSNMKESLESDDLYS